MTAARRQMVAYAFPWACALVFLLMALALTPYPGLQNDEMFFANPVYATQEAYFRMHFAGWTIPVMVLSYLGALKTWLYAGIFKLAAPSIWSVRVPVVLAGCGTILLTWTFVRRLAGVRAAAVATVLLATDASFLLTNTFDWGPVALQHVLLMGGLLAVLSWVQAEPHKRSEGMLALGCFLWGVGLWDKALMIWPLLGLSFGVLLVYPRAAFRRFSLRVIAMAVAAAMVGAAPLVWYNIARRGETATENSKFSTGDMRHKVEVLRQTLRGSLLFGYMARDDGPDQRAPDTPLEKASVWVADAAGGHRSDWMIPAMVVALVAGLALGTPARRKSIRFTAVFLMTTWTLMALTRNAGGAAHHVVLLWPFPMVLVGLGLDALAAGAARWGGVVVAMIVAAVSVQNVLNINQYLAAFIRNGASTNWSDAVQHLSDALPPVKEIEVVDWGYLNTIRVLHRGNLSLQMIGDWLEKPTMTPTEREILRKMIASRESLFVLHTDGNEMFPNVNTHLRAAAEEMGYRGKRERVVRDSNGRPIFELVRFERRPAVK